MDRLGIITGLTSEIRCLGELTDAAGVLVRCAGADPARAGALARQLVAEGSTALVSFGMAGGLDPTLRSGDVVVASGVAGPDGPIATDEAWAGAVREKLAEDFTVSGAPIAAAAGVVATPAAKAALRGTTGAGAVDMESQAIGAAAREAGVRFLVVRVIADTADDGIPEWLLGVLDADGQPRPMRFLQGIVGRPGDLGRAIRLARASGRALESLRRVAARLGPGFGLSEFGG